MESVKAQATSTTAIFVGIGITKRSLETGIASYSEWTWRLSEYRAENLESVYWYPIMQAFRAANEQLCRKGSPCLPEELLLRVQSYVRVVGDQNAQQGLLPDLFEQVGK